MTKLQLTSVFLPAALFLAALTTLCASENPWASYRFAPDAVKEIDLAAEQEWTLSVDGGALRPIKVTAGGWNSDQQSPVIAATAVKDHVVYERMIIVPAEARGRVVKVLFGGCNYGAEVFLDGKKITEHHAPMTPFTADLTAVATPGRPQRLRIVAYHRPHYGKPAAIPAGFDFNYYQDKPCTGSTKFAYGLTGHVRLAIYPPVYIADVFVRPSVSGNSLAYEVWIANGSAQARTVTLTGALTPWGERSWKYPVLPQQTVTVDAGATQKVSAEGVVWGLGPQSYWWPNIPFKEDYQATLHWLKLTLAADGQVVHQRQQRFGFVEHAEGPYYYTVNGVRYTGFGDSNSYGQIGEYDCWTESSCFQPPHGNIKGCAETWKRYQRIGFNSMRLSTSVPTPYMLDTADEAGYMLHPEGGHWQVEKHSTFHPVLTPLQLQETIVACRNHPCVQFYSLANEVAIGGGALAKPDWPFRRLIDAALEVDPTRPLVFNPEPDKFRNWRLDGVRGGHAMLMGHYDRPEPSAEPRQIRGNGECAWMADGIGPLAANAIRYRLHEYAYFSPWSWLNYWTNFLEGMSNARHPWKNGTYGDRKDRVDGWNSPVVQTLQRALHPYLVLDLDMLEWNPWINEPSKAGRVDWPYVVPMVAPGAIMTRELCVFNGGLTPGAFSLRWQLHFDRPDGELAGEGVLPPVTIEPGCHIRRKLSLAMPASSNGERKLYLVVESLLNGQCVYRDDRLYFTLSPAAAQGKIQYRGQEKWAATGDAVAGGLPKDVPVQLSSVQAIKEATPFRSQPNTPLLVRVDAGTRGRVIRFDFAPAKEPELSKQRVEAYVNGALADQREVDGSGMSLAYEVTGSVQFLVRNLSPVARNQSWEKMPPHSGKLSWSAALHGVRADADVKGQ